MNLNVVGKPLNRVGGRERVSGSQFYIGDLSLPGMLHAKLVKIDCAHAKIISVDASAALKLPGVRAVFTADDFPESTPRFGPAFQDRPLLAWGETKFHGEPVAIVAAETEYTAAVAASLVRVDYEEMPAVFTLKQALDPASELVQAPAIRNDNPLRNTNILEEYNFGWGTPETADADLVIENTYTFPMITHFAIEPFTFLAEPSFGGITVYTATQNPFLMQSIIARVLKMPIANVRVVSPDPGGAFGGKQHTKYEPLLALAAIKLGRPLRLELSLEESFQTARRTATEVRIKSGFSSDGKITFQNIEADYLLGAYADIGSRVAGKASYVAAGPYRCPAVRIKTRAVLSHTVPSTAFRGFGVPQVNWALESQIDAAARELKIDRVAIRLKNLPEKGEVLIPGDLPVDGNWAESLHKAAEAVGWGSPLKPNCGRGIAMGLKMGATTAASYAMVRLHQDASATVYFGTCDMGQGARTVFTQMVSEELGVPVERIVTSSGDTTTVPFDLQTSASRSTVFMGTAIVDACSDIKQQLKELTAEVYSCKTEEIEVLAGTITLQDKRFSYEELMKERFRRVKGEITGFGTARSEGDASHPLGGQPAFYEVVCIASELHIDMETGETDISRLIVAGDVGKAINPQHVSMQDQGAAIQGLGHSVMEQFIFDDNGRILNLGALDYRIPTTMDIPKDLRSFHIENSDGPGPFGCKGCSEGGILSVAPAIAGAVEEAAGVRLHNLPMNPESIWQAIKEKEEKEQ